MDKIATPAHAQAIINALDDLPLPQQLSCLIAMIFSHVLAATENNDGLADPLMQKIIEALPMQWEAARAALTANTIN